MAPAIINTQLGAGLDDVRGLRKVEPEDVGDAIVRALQRPRFAIWVPRAMGLLALTMSGLPYRLRGRLARLSNADKLLLNADRSARAVYENAIAGHDDPPVLRR